MDHMRPGGMYTAVDETHDPGLLMALMDLVQDAPDVRQARQEALDGLDLRVGDQVLDVGCGTGDHSREIAAKVSPGGGVVAVDFSRTMIEEAKRRHAAGHLPVTFEVGDAQALRFAPDTFDACRTERMLCHVPNCGVALSEMVRVVVPGGRLVAIDVDSAGLEIDDVDTAVTKAFVDSASRSIPHTRMGSQLGQRFAQVGLVNINVRRRFLRTGYDAFGPIVAQHERPMIDSGAVTARAFAKWEQGLIDAHDSGRHVVRMPLVIAHGRKPN